MSDQGSPRKIGAGVIAEGLNAVGNGIKEGIKEPVSKLVGTIIASVLATALGTLGFKVFNHPPSGNSSGALDFSRIHVTGVHISGETQRNDASAFMKRIRAKGPAYLPSDPDHVTRIDNNDGTFPRNHITIRYWYQEDMPAAQAIADLSPTPGAQIESHQEVATKPKQGNLEIWYPWNGDR